MSRSLSAAVVMVLLAGCLAPVVGEDPEGEPEQPDGESGPEILEGDAPTDESIGPESSGTRELAIVEAGLCTLAQHGHYHLVANKFASEVGATSFDVVRGDAYVRRLEICIGFFAGQGGSWVLPANVESDSGTIYQLGYGRAAGRGDNYFVYALGSPTAIEIKSVAPIVGHRYRFEIWKRASYSTVSFKITDLSTSPATVVWSLNTSTPWSSSVNHAWWGYETWDSFSHHGVAAGRSGVNMAYMGYSSNTSATIYYRSGLDCADIWKNFTWDGSSAHNGCAGKRRSVTGTWSYGGDKFDGLTY